jgi:hypothetical protein
MAKKTIKFVEHEHQFPEEEAPCGARILYPCLLCGLAAGDAMLTVADRQRRVSELLEQLAHQWTQKLESFSALSGELLSDIDDIRALVPR